MGSGSTALSDLVRARNKMIAGMRVPTQLNKDNMMRGDFHHGVSIKWQPHKNYFPYPSLAQLEFGNFL